MTQEETAETIVPDYCPDIARIIETQGAVFLHGREIRDGVPLRELTGDHRLEVTAVPGNGKLCFSAKDVV